MTKEQRDLHERYKNDSPKLRAMVDKAFNAVLSIMKIPDISLLGDDRAEALVAEIYRYYRDAGLGD